MEDEVFCGICLVEGRSECEEHGEDDDFNDTSAHDDGWHAEWERDNFGDRS